MKNDLADIFQTKYKAQNLVLFLHRLHRSDKIIELISFIIWEIKYQFKLYKSKHLVKFINNDPYRIFKKYNFDSVIESKSFKISKSKINWEVIYIDNSKNLWGKVVGDKYTLYNTSKYGETVKSYNFEKEIKSVYISRSDNIFCCVRGELHKYCFEVDTFRKVLELSDAKVWIRHEAFTEDPNGNLFFGEYANVFENKKWKFTGYIYHSADKGKSWKKIDFLKTKGVNKHVHILKWSHVAKGLVLTDGDNQKNIWFNKSKICFDKVSDNPELGWKKVNKLHINKGGYTAMAEFNGNIIFGTDYQGGTNFLIFTKDMMEFDQKVMPSPYRRAIFDRIIVRLNNKDEFEIWATTVFKFNSMNKSLLMLSDDYGKTWQKIIEYNGDQYELRFNSNSNQIDRELYFSIKDKALFKISTMHIT